MFPSKSLFIICSDLHRGVKILLFRGDITTFEVDVIVSSASSKLTSDGGISAAMVSAGF